MSNKPNETVEELNNIPTRSNTKSNTKRLQIDLPDESFEKLKKIKEMNGFSSYTEMFKEMVRLYHYVLNEEFNGTKFWVKRGDNFSELALFALKP